MLDFGKFINHASLAEDLAYPYWHDELPKRAIVGNEMQIRFLPQLNEKLFGLRRGKMYVIGGRPSQGKSTVMLQMAMDCCLQGKNVSFYTFEMDRIECFERMFCCCEKVNNRDLISGLPFKPGQEVYNQKLLEKYNNFVNAFKDLNFSLIEGFGKTFEELNDSIFALNKPDIVFIDYINLIRQQHRSKKETIDEYLKDLFALCKSKNICVVIGAQISREAHKNNDGEVKPPEMWHLKDSGVLEEAADCVLLVHWNYIYSKKPEQKNEYLISVKKNRSGMTGNVDCVYIPEFYRIESGKYE